MANPARIAGLLLGVALLAPVVLGPGGMERFRHGHIAALKPERAGYDYSHGPHGIGFRSGIGVAPVSGVGDGRVDFFFLSQNPG